MLYWDEELQDWVEDDTAEQVPPKPPIALGGKVDSELGGEYVGARGGTLDDKYRARQMARAEIEAQANRFGPPSPSPNRSGELVGYGNRVMYQRGADPDADPSESLPPSRPWMTAGGNVASPEYVQDIEKTLDARDSGEMSETQLRERIKAQEGMPKPPSEAELRTTLDIINFRKAMLPKIQEQAVEAANQDWQAMSKGRDLSWQALNKDKEIAERVKFYLNEGLKDLNRNIDKRYTALVAQEQAANAPKTPQDYVNAALTEKLGRKPTAQESLDGLAEYNAKSAGAKSGAVEKGKKDVQLGLLDPDTLKIEGIKFATTGKMTAMGMGGGPYIRTAIMNAAAAHLKENNVDPASIPAMQTEYNAAAQAFTSIKKSTEQVKGFENGLIKNADYALELSKDIFRTNLIPVNEVVNYFRTKTGSPEIVKFGAAIYAAAMEYEKVRTAGTGITSAELSIGAQKKAEEIMNKAMTHKQLEGVVEAMKQDTSNIMEGRTETLKTMDREMRNLDSMFGRKGNVEPSRGGERPSQLSELPPASQYKGRIVKRNDGARLQSDGQKWVIVERKR